MVAILKWRPVLLARSLIDDGLFLVENRGNGLPHTILASAFIRHPGQKVAPWLGAGGIILRWGSRSVVLALLMLHTVHVNGAGRVAGCGHLPVTGFTSRVFAHAPMMVAQLCGIYNTS